MSARTVVVAGAQRSASTSLAEQLGRHPQIAMEPRELTSLEDPYYPAALPGLLARLAGAHGRGLVAGFKRPELLHGRGCVDRIARHVRGAVVVISLREPAARTVSAYLHYVRHGLLPALGLDKGLSRLLDRRERSEPWEPGDQVLAYSLYAAGVRRFLAEDTIDTLVAFQEDIVHDPAAVGLDVARRLGIEPVDLGPFPRANGQPHQDRFGVERVANRICYDVDRECQTLAVSSSVVRRAAGRALRRVATALPSLPAAHDAVDPQVRQRLLDVLAPDAIELEQLLARPLPDPWRTALAL